MMDTDTKSEEILFDRQKDYKLGAVTYHVTAHFDSDSESILPKIKRLLQNALETEISQPRQQSD